MPMLNTRTTKRISMIYSLFFTLIFSLINTVFASNSPTPPTHKMANVVEKSIHAIEEEEIDSIYHNLTANNFELPKLESFAQAMKGYQQLKKQGVIKKDILTLIDFSLSANTKRLWVIDLTTQQILFHSLVAHGKNTGEEFANSFSNRNESNQSSLGFYSTGEVYRGKHGISLKLDGLEKGINHNARARAIVLHGATYVSESFIRNHKRLGRSLGCPAVPNELTLPIINTIKENSLLFIYHPSRATADTFDALTS